MDYAKGITILLHAMVFFSAAEIVSHWLIGMTSLICFSMICQKRSTCDTVSGLTRTSNQYTCLCLANLKHDMD